jgi:hypothetical protein
MRGLSLHSEVAVYKIGLQYQVVGGREDINELPQQAGLPNSVEGLRWII